MVLREFSLQLCGVNISQCATVLQIPESPLARRHDVAPMTLPSFLLLRPFIIFFLDTACYCFTLAMPAINWGIKFIMFPVHMFVIPYNTTQTMLQATQVNSM